MISAAAILLGSLMSLVRLEAKPSAETSVVTTSTDKPVQTAPQPANSERASPLAREKDSGKSISYTGHVLDAETNKPVQGAKVTVYRKLSRDPKTGGWNELGSETYETAADGSYTFVIPPEEAAQPSLYLETEVHHPQYAAKSREGYSHTMIRKNLAWVRSPGIPKSNSGRAR